MKPMTKTLFCLLSPMFVYSSAAVAEGYYSDGDFYFGAKLGGALLDSQAKQEPEENKAVNLSSGLVFGYNLNRYLALESDLSYLGKGQDKQQSTLSADKHLFSIATYLSTRYRLSDEASLYFKLGPAWVNDDISISSGLGIKYRFSPRWELDTGYRWIKDTPSTDDDLYEFTLGFNYKFGVVSHPSVRPAIDPMHKPLDKQQVLITPTINVQSVSIRGNSVFGFDSSKLTDTSALDEVIKSALASKNASISVTAYTDSLGAERYNLALAKRRAEATQAYFITHGVAPSRIHIDWKGEENPVSSNMTAKGRALNRRVEIEIAAHTD
ncbi:OmpA family protein [Shewanella pealeana]|uniref:OmpA/MotB domain protein n=1 Tax=Shewanella pealeana (strain ATCC 700345 / ANG-SQ1) TaxID=398579 RepID=A8H638_SHEPA|nr:OmpA family protein [Shewanella pealeana]ABV88025.1 OmpA/MotB domain protein [Shewanella pealeana ATCC 700345]